MYIDIDVYIYIYIYISLYRSSQISSQTLRGDFQSKPASPRSFALSVHSSAAPGALFRLFAALVSAILVLWGAEVGDD